jgi:hypothetical protein
MIRIQTDISFTGQILSAKALDIKNKLLSTHENERFLSETEFNALTAFKASESWVGKFAQDNGLTSRALHGKAGDVDVEEPDLEIQQLRELIKKYNLDKVYNMDETGSFYKQIPNCSYVRKNKAARSARGTKSMKAKNRVILYITTNATGTVLVPLSMIGKSENPRCFTNHPKNSTTSLKKGVV